ncbi:MAG TPA: hypothetical protein DHV62_08160 [Elusimicrobia bacterium]|jgi:DNA-binding NarL/FixJ family response regulator|nr:hypothetical protein [Elusimicrobiota bacterium]
MTKSLIKDKINHYGFSHQEMQVVKCVIKGLSNKEIASVLDISENTVKEYLSNIFRKAGVSNRTTLAVKILLGNRQNKKLNSSS